MFTLTWQPPYDWQWMLKFLGDRAVAGIETVTPTDYTRSFACLGHRGLIRVTPQPGHAGSRAQRGPAAHR